MDNQKRTPWPMSLQIQYPEITEGALSPDGTRAVYGVREVWMADDRSEEITHLYLVDRARKDTFQLTFGDYSNRMARWSPDGKHLAFLSTRSGKANIYVIRADGGEAWALTKFEKTQVERLSWAPDGKSLVFMVPEPPSAEKEAAQKAKNDPLYWDVDFDFTHLYQVSFEVGPRVLPEAVQLTAGRFHVVGFDWFPDSQSLALAYRPNPTAETWQETRLARLNLGEKAPPLAQGELQDFGLVRSWEPTPSVSPDGQWIACIVDDVPVRWAYSNRVALFPAEGGAPRLLAYTPDQQCWLIGWDAAGDHVVAADVDGLCSQIWTLPVSGASGRRLTETSTYKIQFWTSPADRLVYSDQDFTQPHRLRLLDIGTGETELLAAPAMPAGWPDDPLPRVEILHWQSTDGLDIEGYLIYPHDHVPGKQFPLVVQVHGGPAGYFSRTFLGSHLRYLDVLGLAAHGIGTLRVNPRGSSGYGKAFRFANIGDWGGGDYQDIMSGVDMLVARGDADPDRLGITGWSYGGFMTSWTITQTHRFKAACVGAGVTNLISFNGTADIPGFVPDYFGGEFWDDLTPYQTHSPVFQAKGITTPTLILHGAADIRVPLSQGRELYNALKRQGTPVEMVIYPRQGHALTEPRMRLDARRQMRNWFLRWLTSP